MSIVFELNQLNQHCKTLGNRVVVITDDHVGPLYADQLPIYDLSVDVITIAHGEQNKSRMTKALIEDQMFELGCGRDTVIVALGGGVITDLAGFVAATFCRGIPAIYIPTSLLAMVDAACGGKTGINTKHGKNLLGTFTQPKMVMIDPRFIATLPEQEYYSAFAEIIKHALIFDVDYFEFLRAHVQDCHDRNPACLRSIIKRSLEIKQHFVMQDEREAGIRAMLNFGHTIGHAIENVLDYAIAHGHAVAYGMLVEAKLSIELCGFPKIKYQQIQSILSAYHLPLQHALHFDDIRSALHRDKKKTAGQLQIVLLEDIGRPRLTCVSEEQIEKVFSVEV